MSQIFVILMKKSSWSCVLFTSSDLIIFDISSKLKSDGCSLDCIRTCWLAGGTLSFFKEVHCSAENLLSLFGFVLYLLQIYHLLKEVDFFAVIKRFENRPVGFSLNNGSFNFFPIGCLSGWKKPVKAWFLLSAFS